MATYSPTFGSSITLTGQKTLRRNAAALLRAGRENRQVAEIIDATMAAGSMSLTRKQVESPASPYGGLGGAVTVETVTELSGSPSAAQKAAIRADVSNVSTAPTYINQMTDIDGISH